MINHSPASSLMPCHVNSQKTVHLELSLVRGFNSETTELKSKELLRHRFLAKKHANPQLLDSKSLCILWLSRGRRCRGIVWSSGFFWAQRIALFFVEAKCGRKIREKGTQPCHNVAFCFIERRGDNYGRWQGRQGTEFFLKPFDFLCCTFKDSKALLRVLCSFPARPCRQMEAMEREAGCRVMAGCGFSSVVDPFQDFVTWFLEKEMTEVAGSMKERTVTKAG